jgi:predicted ArsR family transcriptional regulator
MDETGRMDEDLQAIGALTDPARRAAYRVVVDAGPEPVGRDEVAAALGVGRTLAAFHLDKLVAAGLLEASYARRSGRSGPGAGRPAKLYRRATGVEHTVSVPPRAYDTIAGLLAEAVEATGADAAAYAAARRRGRAEAAPGDVVAVLAERGYEPEAVDGVVRLRNCPFHHLADDFPPLVCGMNLALVEGLTEGAGWAARIDPTPGGCCVTLSKNS